MKKTILHNNHQFETWLAEHAWFQDGSVLRLDPLPCEDGCIFSTSAQIELAYQIEGDYKAYSKKVSRHFILSLSGIQQYSIPKDCQYHEEHCSEGIDILEECEAIGFQIDTPGLLTVVCSNVVVQELPNLVETVKPWLSKRDIHAKVPNTPMPSPRHWVDRFERIGKNVSWHLYGGNPCLSAEVPMTDYQGWFLQISEELDMTHQGIFFFACKPTHTGFSVQIENHGASPELWNATKQVLGQFNGTIISCGNCEFTSEEWHEELRKDAEAQQEPGPTVR